MIESIISNDCIGGAVCHDLGMEFKSPTVNLQILPEEFPEFCADLKYYMECPLVEYKAQSREHRQYLVNMYGYIPEMPLGLIDDIMVCFQHYATFEEAAKKWNERKARIDYDNIGYIFHARDKKYAADLVRFIDLKLPNSIGLTENHIIGYDVIPNIKSFFVPEGEDAYWPYNGKPRILSACDFKSWREND